MFAHLTLQEHGAGRYLAVQSDDPTGLIMRHRAEDRWREPILLGLGVAQQTNPAPLDRVLSDLIDPDETCQPKSVERRQRDLIFAAEIGQDRDWGYLRTQRVNVDRLQRDLKRGLVELLGDTAKCCFLRPMCKAFWAKTPAGWSGGAASSSRIDVWIFGCLACFNSTSQFASS